MPITAPPSSGQMVTVRRRPYVVVDVQRSQLAIDPTRNPTNSVQHRVKLSCLDDDALGEELEVIWEIEAGAPGDQSTGQLPIPDKFDDPARLDAFLNAVRWGAISSSEDRVLQAPFRSGITIEDYQLDPVARALQMPRVNLLVADDVGLGKTIEAGLVIEELILRQRIRTVLIICPSAIQIQWQEQMLEKFGLQFDIVNSEYVRNLRKTRGLHANPWNQRVHLITSIDYIKREQPMRLFSELLPADGQPTYPRAFDMMIVDEAHNVAPSSSKEVDSSEQQQFADWLPTSNTNSSSPRHRTTATKSVFHRCWNYWTTSVSRVGLNPTQNNFAPSWFGASNQRSSTKMAKSDSRFVKSNRSSSTTPNPSARLTKTLKSIVPSWKK